MASASKETNNPDPQLYSGKHPYLVGSQRIYGEPLIEYLNQHEIGRVACWYDDE